MNQTNHHTENPVEDDEPFVFIGRYDPYDADRLFGIFKDHHIRCSAEVDDPLKRARGGHAGIDVYVHPNYFNEAKHLCKELSLWLL